CGKAAIEPVLARAAALSLARATIPQLARGRNSNPLWLSNPGRSMIHSPEDRAHVRPLAHFWTVVLRVPSVWSITVNVKSPDEYLTEAWIVSPGETATVATMSSVG